MLFRSKHWPDVKRYGDIHEFTEWDLDSVELICGGDPCQSRSRAGYGHKSRAPDLSGYFLAVVGRVRPRWVVRENVFAPDVINFSLALEALGYRSFIVELDGADFTSCSRPRQFIIGCNQPRAAAKIFASISEFEKSVRSEEHTSELQSHSFISYAVFCLKKKTQHPNFYPPAFRPFSLPSLTLFFF